MPRILHVLTMSTCKVIRNFMCTINLLILLLETVIIGSEINNYMSRNFSQLTDSQPHGIINLMGDRSVLLWNLHKKRNVLCLMCFLFFCFCLYNGNILSSSTCLSLVLNHVKMPYGESWLGRCLCQILIDISYH